jgi:hypothetical protein
VAETVILEKKLKVVSHRVDIPPTVITVDVPWMLWLEWKSTRGSCKVVVLCANIEVAKRECRVAVVEDAVLEIAVVNVSMEIADVEAVAHEAAFPCLYIHSFILPTGRMPKSAGCFTLHAQLLATHAIGWMGSHHIYPTAQGGQELEQVPSEFSVLTKGAS